MLGEVLRLAGESAEAASALAEAAVLYERKGNVVFATKAQAPSQSWAEAGRSCLGRAGLRILGSLEVSEGARLVSLGGPRQQALLACLLIRTGEPVATDWLIEQLWKDGTDDPAATLQVAVSRLRKALGDRP